MLRKVLFLISGVLLIGCGDATGPRDMGVFARLDANGLILRNNTAGELFYVAVERNTAAAILLAHGCTDTSEQTILPRKTITIPYSEVYGWESGSREVLVYLWFCRPSIEGELVPVEIHHEIARR
jgi:hypothetical protein